jgi:hypothetical protein
MKRKDLENKLEAVKLLKQQYYVGTSEALEYLRAHDRISNPQAYVESLGLNCANPELVTAQNLVHLEHLLYLQTESLSSIERKILIHITGEESPDPIDGAPNEYYALSFPGNTNGNWSKTFSSILDPSKLLDEFAREYFQPILDEVNAEDKSFLPAMKRALTKRIKHVEELDKENKINPLIYIAMNRFAQNIVDCFTSFMGTEIPLPEEYLRLEQKKALSQISSWMLSPSSHRIIRDQLGKYSHHRRQIAQGIIEQSGNSISKAKRSLEFSKKRLESRTKELENFGSPEVLEKHNKMLEGINLQIRSIRDEENWLRKFYSE